MKFKVGDLVNIKHDYDHTHTSGQTVKLGTPGLITQKDITRVHLWRTPAWRIQFGNLSLVYYESYLTKIS